MANARERRGLTSGEVRRAVRATQKLLADVGGANSPELKAAGRALAKAIRTQLSRTGPVIPNGGTIRDRKAGTIVPRRGTSAPGEPPHMQTARLRRSVRQLVVDGERRVGTTRFTGKLLEEGVVFTGRASVAAGGTYLTPSGRRRRSKKARKAAAARRIAPRPFMERALDLALPSMREGFVVELRKRTR